MRVEIDRESGLWITPSDFGTPVCRAHARQRAWIDIKDVARLCCQLREVGVIRAFVRGNAFGRDWDIVEDLGDDQRRDPKGKILEQDQIDPDVSGIAG